MEFSVTKAALLNELSMTQGVVERKTTIPILSNLLVEAKGSQLTITATDLELSIRTSCDAKVKKEGAGTIPAKKLLELVRSIKPSHVDCFYVRQPEALGLGHAVLCAEKLVGDNPFAVILADDLLYGTPPVMQQMIEVFDHYHSSVIGVEEIPRDETKSYGIVDGKEWEDAIIKMSGIVEKPAPEVAPSNLGVVGRYVLMPRIFEFLRTQKPGAGNEIQLTDAIQALLKEEQVLAFRYHGQRFDCGSKLGYLKATVEFALRHPEVKSEFEEYLRTRSPILEG